MNTTDDLQILSDYIRNEVGYNGALDPDTDLLDAQILDSFSIVQLAMFVQQRFEIELEAEDLVRANLAKLANIVELIRAKRER